MNEFRLQKGEASISQNAMKQWLKIDVAFREDGVDAAVFAADKGVFFSLAPVFS